MIAWYKSRGYALVNQSDGGEGPSGYKHTKKALKALSKLSKRNWKKVSHRKKVIPKIRKSTKSSWKKPAHSKKVSLAVSKGIKNLCKDKTYIKRMSSGAKRSWKNPKSRANRLRSLRKAYKSKRFKEAQSKRKKKFFSNARAKRKWIKARWTPKHRKQQGKRSKALWKKTLYRQIFRENLRKMWRNKKSRAHRIRALKLGKKRQYAKTA